MRSCCFRFILALALICSPSAISAAEQSRMPLQALDLDTPFTLDSVVTQLAAKGVVFVGETHDRYDHHLNQLEIIKRLHQLDANLVIGVEYFQQRFQPQVDDYIAGRITEDKFLRAIDYYRTWGYDYRSVRTYFSIRARAENSSTCVERTGQPRVGSSQCWYCGSFRTAA